MPDIVLTAIVLIGSYLLGAFPQVYLLGKLKGADLRYEDDLHIALYHRVSRTLGVIGLTFDLAKGALPILAARWLGLELWAVAAAGLLVVLGQMWSALLPGTGGRGNSTGLVMSFALDYPVALWALIPIGLAVAVRTLTRWYRAGQIIGEAPSRSLPLGMILGFATLPMASLILGRPWEITAAFLGLFLAIVIRRLTVGLLADLKLPASRKQILFNRLLWDRSFLEGG